MNDYDRIAHIITYLNERHQEQPGLTELAAHAGLSPYHFHRLFTRWAGVTPKDFLKCLTLTHAQGLLRTGCSVLQTALDVGLSGPSRLHDLCVSLEAASPGELKSGGKGWVVNAGFVETPFGTCALGEGPRGICYLSFVDKKSRQVTSDAIQATWPGARTRWDSESARRSIEPLFAKRKAVSPEAPLRAYVRGSEFQVRVWRALLRVPTGALVTYSQIAEAVGAPSAARAVGTAVARNPLAYLIPCHRVIRRSGVLGDYRWDPIRKKAMVAWEGISTSGDS